MDEDLAYNSSGGGGAGSSAGEHPYPASTSSIATEAVAAASTSMHRPGGPGDNIHNLYNQLQSHFADSHSESALGLSSSSLRLSSALNVSATLAAPGSSLTSVAALSPLPNPGGQSANQSFATSPPLNSQFLKDDGERLVKIVIRKIN